MSLAIQDNLIKTNLVQQQITKSDDVARGQEIGVASMQKEINRQQDEVVISTKHTEDQNIHDEEKEKGEQEEKEEKERRERKKDEPEEDDGPRAKMRTINVVI